MSADDVYANICQMKKSTVAGVLLQQQRYLLKINCLLLLLCNVLQEAKVVTVEFFICLTLCNIYLLFIHTDWQCAFSCQKETKYFFQENDSKHNQFSRWLAVAFLLSNQETVKMIATLPDSRGDKIIRQTLAKSLHMPVL